MDVIELRREFHQFPELAFTEFYTASRVVEILQSLGYEVLYGSEAMEPSVRKRTPSGEKMENEYRRALENGAKSEILEKMRGGLTAVIGVLQGKEPGPTVAFRFDMDAVQVEESTESDHRPQIEGFFSKYPGIMHACGHDGHTAIGLCFAEKMAKGDFAGTLKLIFQPAEEGCCGGAQSIVAKGIVDDVDQIFCMHLIASQELGSIVGGTQYLSTTKLAVEFFGVAAHAASAPEKGRNALLGAATALLNIHALPPYPNMEARFNVGILEGGTAPNIIPAYAKMVVDLRAQSGKVVEELVERVERIIKASADMHGLDYKIQVIGESITANCDEESIAIALEEAQHVGFHTLIEHNFSTGSEDATYLIQRVQECGGKGTYMNVGSAIPEAHHSSKFDIDEKVLPLSVQLVEAIARRTLR